MVRIALGQINVTVGDLDGNAAKMAEWSRRAADSGADLVCFPELAIPGYPPEDLVLRRRFVDDNLRALDDLAEATSAACPVLTGFVDRTDAGLHNAAALLAGGRVVARYHKIKLPNYGVFDEKRYFVPGNTGCEVRVASSALGISVCEDAWWPGAPFEEYRTEHAAIVPNINASPYHRGKSRERIDICRARVEETDAWFAYVNMVGGQDELVFDGGSLVMSPDGDVTAHACLFEEDLLVVDIDVPAAPAGFPGPAVSTGEHPKAPLPQDDRPPWIEGPEEVYGALVVGLRDYVGKNDFKEVVIGLSGGIDSALTAALGADALGAECVRTVAMPSPYSSQGSLDDARDVAGRLGVRLDVVPIGEILDAYRDRIEGTFSLEGIAEENLQARIRGNLLMAMSNRFGSLVLATGNKSEMATGYSTLYGDMAGGFAPIKDVPKTLVYELCAWRNTRPPAPIPERVMTKPPSAELRPGQKDTDSLPVYEELDPILERYIEGDASVEDLIDEGFEADLVWKVVGLVERAEYKRRQAPPGVKITPKAFGRDRRLPITNAYRRGRPPMAPAGPTSPRAETRGD
jgi:NAD+ synthase (glutamine-hydrolysing)